MQSKYIHELSDMEKKTILALAERGPMSGYDFHLGGKRQRRNRKAIMSSGSWNRISKTLGSNGLKLIEVIQKQRMHSEDNRGRRKDLIWLTEEGINTALFYGASVSTLISIIKKIHPEAEWTIIVLEWAQVLGLENYFIIHHVFNAVKSGKMPLHSIPINPEAMKSMVTVLRRHPNVKNDLKGISKGVSDFKKEIDKLISDM